MNLSPAWPRHFRALLNSKTVFVLLLLASAVAYAQAGDTPFDTGFTALQKLFTGTVAKVASLIAIVIGGYGFAHGDPGAKKALAGVAAGTGIAVLAVNVLTWLWGGLDPTLGAVIEVYAREEMPERQKSRQNYSLLINRHIQPKWRSNVLSEIRPHAVEVWLREMPYSPETKRHIKSMPYRLFELAMKRDWLEAQRNPMRLVRVKGRNWVVEKVVLTPEQMLIVRRNLDDPYLLMTELTCYLGLRICEVLGLMWGDFDPVEKTLSIKRSAVDGHVADVKSEASRDVIPLSGDFISFLLRWQRIAPHSDEGWMFPSIVTGRPYHAGILLRRHLKPLTAKVGVPRLGWHTFRHTFRSWLDAVGTAVGVQQKMMRHADVATTMNVYGKAMMDSKLHAIQNCWNTLVWGFVGLRVNRL